MNPAPVWDFEFRHGICELTVQSGNASISIESHWLNDRLTDLTHAVTDLLSGRETVSCRWQGPVQEGHFIDLVRDPEDGVNLAISSFPYPEGASAREIWSARRGDPIFEARASLAEFAVAVATALRIVRDRYVTGEGLLHEYPRPFPNSMFERIEELASRLGYRPQARQ